MSSIAIRRPQFRSAPPDLAGEAAAALAIAGLAAALTWLIDDQGLLFGVAVVLGACTAAWLLTTRRTLFALALLMLYLGVLDGYLKLATGVTEVTFLRDLLLYAVAVGLLVRAQVSGIRLTAPPLTAWVAGFVVLVLIQVFNPQGGTFVHSLAGVRQHLEFVPLFFLTFVFVRTTAALRWFVVLLVLVAAANGLASWVQFNSKPEQLAAWGPGYAERVNGTGRFAASGRAFFDTVGTRRTRPFGLGSEVGSGGVIGALALGGIIALASLVERKRYLLLSVAMAIGAVTAVVTSEGRAAVICAVVVVLAYGLLTATSRGGARGLLGLALAGIVAAFVVQSFAGTGSAFRYEGLSATKIVQTTNAARPGNTAAILTAMTSYPLGAGLATSGPASGAPGGTDIGEAINTENQFSFSTIETGIPGMALIVGFTITLFLLGVRRLRHEPDREARELLTALIAPIAGMIALYYASPLTATTPTGPYLWAVAGIVSYWLVARPAERRTAPANPALP
jgi:hypothetical protein